jgi:hypothetical protein
MYPSDHIPIYLPGSHSFIISYLFLITAILELTDIVVVLDNYKITFLYRETGSGPYRRFRKKNQEIRFWSFMKA